MRYCLSAYSEIDRRLLAARRILVASDLDGTLCPIAASPREVRIPHATFETLRRMGESDRITLAVISGRALHDVSARLPLDIAFAGNHGLEILGKGYHFEHPGARAFRPHLDAACEDLQSFLASWPGAWVEDKGLSATIHYRAVDKRSHHALVLAVRARLGRFAGRFALRAGNMSLELRPNIAWDKGSALDMIRQHAGPFDLTICLGDDRTDETMFRANAGELNIKVGGMHSTAADYYLSDPSEVAVFLSHVLDFCTYWGVRETGAGLAAQVAAAV